MSPRGDGRGGHRSAATRIPVQDALIQDILGLVSHEICHGACLSERTTAQQAHCAVTKSLGVGAFSMRDLISVRS